jgi:TolB-like protein/AraC-like DNA-binding protein
LKDQKLLDKALQIVTDNMSDESFGIDELRQGLGLSRSQLHRRLQNITGLSAALFIRLVRLRKSLELLKEGDLPVSEVAYRTGFSSPSYFNKCFHEQYGFPPGEIHKQKTTEIDQRNIFNPEAFPGDKAASKKEFMIKKLYFYVFSILVVITLAVILYTSINPSNKTQIHEKSIAVLPFKNFSDNQENQYISDGMMEAIISNISKIGDLKVISRTSMEQYRESPKSVRKIGSELKVSYLLEGSTFQDEKNVRVTVQLIDTKSDKHIWAESYDFELRDIFTVQNQIARKIASILQTKITPEEMSRLEQKPTKSPEAYDLYQRAFYYFINFLQQRQETDYTTAWTLFSKAIKVDTTFAAAYLRLADLYWLKNYRSEYYSETFMDTVFRLCLNALEYNPESSDAHRLLGQYYFETGKREEGINEVEKAISLNRNNASAYDVLGFYYNWFGKWEMGIPAIFKSIQLDPYSVLLPIRYGYLSRGYLDILDFEKTFYYSQKAVEHSEGRRPFLGFAYWVNAHANLMLGNSREVLEATEKLSEINEIAALRIQAEVYSHLFQDFEKSINLYQELSRRDSVRMDYHHRHAYALWEIGEYESANAMFAEQIRIFEKELELGRVERNDPHYNLAGIYAFLGDHQKALEHLRQHKFTSGLEIYAEKDPLFKDLYNNQEFKMIIQNAKEEKEILRNKIEKTVSENYGL